MKLNTIISFESNKVTRGLVFGAERKEFLSEIEKHSTLGKNSLRLVDDVELEILIDKEDKEWLKQLLEKYNVDNCVKKILTPFLYDILKAKVGHTVSQLGYTFDNIDYRIIRFPRKSSNYTPLLRVTDGYNPPELVNVFNFDSKTEIRYFILLNSKFNKLWR